MNPANYCQACHFRNEYLISLMSTMPFIRTSKQILLTPACKDCGYNESPDNVIDSRSVVIYLDAHNVYPFGTSNGSEEEDTPEEDIQEEYDENHND